MGAAAGIVGASIIGSIFQSKAQAKAAKSYGKSADAQTRAIMEMYYQTREDLMPYMQYGEKGLEKYWKELEAGPGPMEASPGYKWRMEEGEKAIGRAATAKGQFFSGKRGKALMEYGQEMASSEYDKFMGRYYQKLGSYLPLIQAGQASAAKTGTQGLQAVGMSSGIQMGAAGARASSYINRGDIYANLAEQIGGLAAYGG